MSHGCPQHCPAPGPSEGAGLGPVALVAMLALGLVLAAWAWFTGKPLNAFRHKPRRYARRVHAVARTALTGWAALWLAYGAVVPIVTGSALAATVAAVIGVRIRRARLARLREQLAEGGRAHATMLRAEANRHALTAGPKIERPDRVTTPGRANLRESEAHQS